MLKESRNFWQTLAKYYLFFEFAKKSVCQSLPKFAKVRLPSPPVHRKRCAEDISVINRGPTLRTSQIFAHLRPPVSTHVRIWTSGEGVGGFGNSDAPGQGRGWFENPRFWRTSFVDKKMACYEIILNSNYSPILGSKNDQNKSLTQWHISSN